MHISPQKNQNPQINMNMWWSYLSMNANKDYMDWKVTDLPILISSYSLSACSPPHNNTESEEDINYKPMKDLWWPPDRVMHGCKEKTLNI